MTIGEKNKADDWGSYFTKTRLGASLMRQHKYADAEPLLLDSYEGMKKREATIPLSFRDRVTDPLIWLEQLYDATGQQDRAEAVRRLRKEAKAPASKPQP